MTKAVSISAVVIAASVAVIFLALPFLMTMVPDGFDEDELNAPSISYDPDIVNWTAPEAVSAPGEDHSLRWWVTPAYSDFGGVINITMENTGNTKLHVYRMGIIWPDHGLESYRDVDVNVSIGRTADLGIIVYRAPSNVSEANYILVLYIEARNGLNSRWWDYGAMYTPEYEMDILPLGDDRSYEVTSNPTRYFNKVGSLVDFDDVQSIADGLRGGYATYDIQQVIAVFDWVKLNIEYVDDPNDDWQSPSETLSLGGGDCEDQAMLVASLVGALGGNARVNLIEGHAFATVFIGSDASIVDDMTEAVISHYGTDLSVFYIEDSFGIWMIVDTTSYQYCGGMPTLSVPTGTGPNDFAFEETDYLYAVDVVG
jgi:hypothetical protein